MTTSHTCRSGDVAEVVLGVDTHLDFHVAVALDQLGRPLGELKVPTTTGGYRRLLSWAEGFGPVRCAGVEGTGSYGANLARHLKDARLPVMEIERPKRRHLKRTGKSDPKDAEAAARAVLAGETAGVPKSGDGRVEMIRTLRGARRSAVKARVQAANLLQSMLSSPLLRSFANVCVGSLRGSWWTLQHACAPMPIRAMCKEPPSSRSARWPAVMWLSSLRRSLR